MSGDPEVKVPQPRTLLPDSTATWCGCAASDCVQMGHEGLSAAWIRVSRELDVATSAQLEQALGEAQDGAPLSSSTCGSSRS
jgi:hypothetical protein